MRRMKMFLVVAMVTTAVGCQAQKDLTKCQEESEQLSQQMEQAEDECQAKIDQDRKGCEEIVEIAFTEGKRQIDLAKDLQRKLGVVEQELAEAAETHKKEQDKLTKTLKSLLDMQIQNKDLRKELAGQQEMVATMKLQIKTLEAQLAAGKAAAEKSGSE